LKLKWNVYINKNLIGETDEFESTFEADEQRISDQRVGFVKKYMEDNNWTPVADSIHYQLVTVKE